MATTSTPDARAVLPNFLIIGAGKSGTTSLWAYLNQHPQVGMSPSKEPSFFSMDEIYARGSDWYAKLFAGLGGMIARGEASNSYSALGLYPRTVERIADALEDPKFIYITRHPKARTESDWMEMTTLQNISFTDFLRTDRIYEDKNQYLRTFEAYSERFGADRILPLFHADLTSDPAALLDRVTRFLGVDPNFAFETDARHGQTANSRRFPPVIRWLRETRLGSDIGLMLPEALKRPVRGLISSRHKVARPIWSSADWDRFRERFEGPSCAYLSRVGADPDRWHWPEQADADPALAR
ncbi:sulfotransferase family protein [Citreimonas salinaria]|uniref:Sulfotransferase family protein n=1 Tax=Citreimonas salinaria TaxID=321339 RepID=A0A1H3EZP4_9RHOB|nr:sulfotransferase [Citreimonas salinaria]SDX84037.1 Sulfotransferase family protein [Citreimonas salinaria]